MSAVQDIYARLGNYDKSIEHFTEAIEDDDSLLARNARGTVYIILGEYGKASSDLLKVKKRKPDFADVYNNLAMMNIRLKKGLMVNSKKSFEEVLKINPNFGLAYHGLGCLELLESQNMFAPEDNEQLQKALELLPETLNLLIANESRYTSALIDKQAQVLYAEVGEEGSYIKKTYEVKEMANKALEERRKFISKSDGFVGEVVHMFQRPIQGERTIQYEENTLKALESMSAGELENFRKTDPTAFRKAYNVAVNRNRVYKIDYEQANNSNKLLNNMNDITSIATTAPMRGPAKVALKTGATLDRRRSENELHRAQAKYNNSNAMLDMMRSIDDKIVPNEIRAPGTTPGQYKRSGSPTGYAESQGYKLNSPGPGQRDVFNPTINTNSTHSLSNPNGGATMERVLITWNNGEWPFDPVFGLLYEIPQIENNNAAMERIE